MNQRPPLIGPRGWVASQLGYSDCYSDYQPPKEYSPFIMFYPDNYDWRDWPELWVDSIHDHVHDA